MAFASEVCIHSIRMLYGSRSSGSSDGMKTTNTQPVATQARDRSCHHRSVDATKPHGRSTLELHHHAGAKGSLPSAKVREPDTAGPTTVRVRRREVACPGRSAGGADVL